ncbi:hypothetical protein TNCV_4737071 [Trichonephila clavipes]|nr:hypothetical protein TNCV_4737071 [Trichonephila clavipes]
MPRCSIRRRIDKADISTPVETDQRAANCLEEAIRPCIAMWSKCRSSSADVTFRRPLPVFELFGAHRSLLPNSHHCGTVPVHKSSYYAIEKSSFSKADNPPTF